MEKLSPMMKQYFEIKKSYQDAILFFRLGDFYEMFFEDAKLVSKELELTLTGRDCGQKERAPMCGVPYHSSEAYIERLIKKGYKVAICEQMEDASSVKGVVKRDVIRVITPGTIIEGSMLDEAKNNFLASIFESEKGIGACFCDTSTCELYLTEITSDIQKRLETEINCFLPSEILFCINNDLINKLSWLVKDSLQSCVEVVDKPKDILRYKELLIKQFGEEYLKNIDFDFKESFVGAVGLLIEYLEKTQKQGLERINNIEIYNNEQFMNIDLNSVRNLELIKNKNESKKTGSLLWVLDKTVTAMGNRLIKNWIERPILSCNEIALRQDAVEELKNNIMLSDSIKDVLSDVFDIERIMTRVTYGSSNAKQVRLLCSSIEVLPKLKTLLKDVKSQLLIDIRDSIDTLDDIQQMIDDAIVVDPPASVKEGGMIKKGYNRDVDDLRELISDGKSILLKIEANERAKTGIPKLKVGYNKVFGYYIEVTNLYKNKVPKEYIRKQTLSNCERYITPELKELEGKVLGAKESLMQLEYVLFDDIRVKVSKNIVRVQGVAKLIAKLDVLRSLAQVARQNKYCRPVVDNSGEIILKDSRHPVVEKTLENYLFVPNDVKLDIEDNRMNIITGPNMAGKSTYMRQIALITLMAQIGSFVPAESARIGVVDKIFTRIGAADDLFSGKSTFMMEMTEVAYILKNATKNSLLILDEIGRGTSTFDGMSIAQSVIEFTANKSNLGSKTLFATHYHELTSLEDKIDGIKNYNVVVKKRGDDITFLRKIVRGKADESYGIQVAKLAGVPDKVVERAKVVLQDLESSKYQDHSACEREKIEVEVSADEKITLANDLVNKIKALDATTLTPIEAMNVLFELTKFVN